MEAKTAQLGTMTVRSAAATHVGKVRKVNEDNLLDRTESGFWVVADGMGGHRRGADASTAIISTLNTAPASQGVPALVAEIRERLKAVNAALRLEGHAAGGPIASTVVCLVLSGDYFACLWAGDSRAYLVRQGRAHRLSHDHSVVQELIDCGVLDPDAAASHPRGNEVTRAVGAYDEFSLDLRQGQAEPGDVFVLCSDGLTRFVPDQELPGYLIAGKPEMMVASLLDTVLERGASDNVSIIVVQCSGPVGTGHDDDETLVLKRR